MAFGTDRNTGFIKIQPVTKFTHPSDLPGGIAYNQSIGRHCSGNDSPCSDKGKFTDIMPEKYGCIGYYRSNP